MSKNTMEITGWRLYDTDGELESFGVLLSGETLILDGIHPAIDTTSDRYPSEVQKFLDVNYPDQHLTFTYKTIEVEL